jgi:putative DNA primase/helicase
MDEKNFRGNATGRSGEAEALQRGFFGKAKEDLKAKLRAISVWAEFLEETWQARDRLSFEELVGLARDWDDGEADFRAEWETKSGTGKWSWEQETEYVPQALWPYFAVEKPERVVEALGLKAAPAILPGDAPMAWAKEFARRFGWAKGEFALAWWHEKFWRWDGIWREWPTADVHAEVTKFLDGAKKREYRKLQGGGLASEDVAFGPKPKNTDDTLKFLRDGCAIGAGVDPGVWLDTGKAAPNVMAFANKVVDVATGEEVEPTPALWIHHSVGYEWDVDAVCPTMDRALAQWFPGDEESPQCSWEGLGAAMVGDRSFEKGLMLIGPTRSGKSTLAMIAAGLVGSTAYASLDANKWMSKDTSTEVLIGKRLGVFEDMRLKPGKWYGPNYDPGGLDHVSVELMLKLTAGNPVTLARKWIGDWEGVVPVKLWIVSNQVPVLNDPVLPGRFVKLAFGECFFGREDITLKARLLEELPGIAQKALRAYRAALAAERLIQPAAGLALKAEVEANSEPIVAFAQDCLVIDGNETVRCTAAHEKFVLWCGRSGNGGLLKKAPNPSKLTKELKKVPGLERLDTTRLFGESGKRYVGFRLRSKLDDD